MPRRYRSSGVDLRVRHTRNPSPEDPKTAHLVLRFRRRADMNQMAADWKRVGHVLRHRGEQAFGASVRRGGTYYVFVFDYPSGKAAEVARTKLKGFDYPSVSKIEVVGRWADVG